jgi:hypothetical protein
VLFTKCLRLRVVKMNLLHQLLSFLATILALVTVTGSYKTFLFKVNLGEKQSCYEDY